MENLYRIKVDQSAKDWEEKIFKKNKSKEVKQTTKGERNDWEA